MEKILRFRWLVVGMYLASALLIIFLLGPVLGREIFPGVRGDQLRLRFRAPTGTRVEVTEQMADEILDEIKSEAGSNNVMMSPTFRNDRDTGTFGPGFDGTSGPLRKPCAGVE